MSALPRVVVQIICLCVLLIAQAWISGAATTTTPMPCNPASRCELGVPCNASGLCAGRCEQWYGPEGLCSKYLLSRRLSSENTPRQTDASPSTITVAFKQLDLNGDDEDLGKYYEYKILYRQAGVSGTPHSMDSPIPHESNLKEATVSISGLIDQSAYIVIVELHARQYGSGSRLDGRSDGPFSTTLDCSRCKGGCNTDRKSCSQCPSPLKLPDCKEECPSGTFYQPTHCAPCTASCKSNAACGKTSGRCPDRCEQWFGPEEYCNQTIDLLRLGDVNTPRMVSAEFTNMTLTFTQLDLSHLPAGFYTYYRYRLNLFHNTGEQNLTVYYGDDFSQHGSRSDVTITATRLEPGVEHFVQLTLYRQQYGLSVTSNTIVSGPFYTKVCLVTCGNAAAVAFIVLFMLVFVYAALLTAYLVWQYRRQKREDHSEEEAGHVSKKSTSKTKQRDASSPNNPESTSRSHKTLREAKAKPESPTSKDNSDGESSRTSDEPYYENQRFDGVGDEQVANDYRDSSIYTGFEEQKGERVDAVNYTPLQFDPKAHAKPVEVVNKKGNKSKEAQYVNVKKNPARPIKKPRVPRKPEKESEKPSIPVKPDATPTSPSPSVAELKNKLIAAQRV